MRVQAIIADPSASPAAVPTRRTAKDIDYLAARLHARRSRMAEAERLDSLCRIQNLQEFFHTIFPDSEIDGVLDFQRLLVHELIGELYGFRTYLSGAGADFIDWTLVRFQMENLKVLIRVCLTKTPAEGLTGYLVFLPQEFALDIDRLAAAETLEDFIRLIPKGIIRNNLEKAFKIYRDHPRPFFFEAALDCGYFQGLITRMGKLSREDQEIIKPMICQEVDIFHLMLVTRGKFHYGLAPEMLRPLHVEGTRIQRPLFATMLNDTELYTTARRVLGYVLDAVPSERGPNEESNAVDAAVLEDLAWGRFFRLVNLAFRRSHMGLGAIIGYTGLRRVEIANLITISEGIHGGIAAETIRGRLIPRTDIVKVA